MDAGENMYQRVNIIDIESRESKELANSKGKIDQLPLGNKILIENGTLVWDYGKGKIAICEIDELFKNWTK